MIESTQTLRGLAEHYANGLHTPQRAVSKTRTQTIARLARLVIKKLSLPDVDPRPRPDVTKREWGGFKDLYHSGNSDTVSLKVAEGINPQEFRVLVRELNRTAEAAGFQVNAYCMIGGIFITRDAESRQFQIAGGSPVAPSAAPGELPETVRKGRDEIFTAMRTAVTRLAESGVGSYELSDFSSEDNSLRLFCKAGEHPDGFFMQTLLYDLSEEFEDALRTLGPNLFPELAGLRVAPDGADDGWWLELVVPVPEEV